MVQVKFTGQNQMTRKEKTKAMLGIVINLIFIITLLYIGGAF